MHAREHARSAQLKFSLSNKTTTPRNAHRLAIVIAFALPIIIIVVDGDGDSGRLVAFKHIQCLFACILICAQWHYNLLHAMCARNPSANTLQQYRMHSKRARARGIMYLWCCQISNRTHPSSSSAIPTGTATARTRLHSADCHTRPQCISFV